MSTLVNVVVRLLVYALVCAAGLALIDLSETTDPLGPGLLLFLLFIVMALVWAVLDARKSAKRALLVWLLVAAGLGLVLSLAAVATDDAATLSAGNVGSTVAFTLVLVYPFALIGTGIGAVVGRDKT